MKAKTQSLAKSSLTLIFARAIVNVSGIAQGVILSRLLTKADNGTYQQIITVVGFYVILALGLPESITYFISKATTEEEKVKKQSAIMTMGVLLSLILILGAAVADPLFVRFFSNTQLSGLGWCIGIILAGNVIQSMFQNTSIVMDHVRDAATMSISYSLGNVLICASLFLYRDNVHLFIYLLAGFNLLMSLLRIGTVTRYFAFRLRPVWEMPLLREVLAFSLPICLSSAIGTVSRYMDRAVIGLFYTPAQFAEYAQGARELPYSIITGAIISVLMPQVIKNFNTGGVSNSIELWKKGMVSSSYLIFFAIGSNILLSREIITVLYSEKYLQSVPVFIVYTLLLVSRVTYWGMFLQAMKKPKLVMVVSLFSLGSNLVLNFVFIKLFGMIGPAISAVTTSYASVGIYLYLNCKNLNVSLKEFLPLKKLGVIIGVNVLAFALFGLLKYYYLDRIVSDNHTVDSIIRILIVGGLWAAGYAAVFRNDLKKIIVSLRQ